MFSRWKNHTRAAALDHLWDHLQTADGSRPPGANERPEAAEAIATVLAHDDAPAIDPIFSALLLKDLTNMHAQQQFGVRLNGHGAPAVTVDRLSAIGDDASFRERMGWFGLPRLRLVAGLAVLAVLLVLGALAARPERPTEPPAIPAAVVQEQGGIESETLVDISFPPGRMQGDDEAQLIFSESTVLPGDSMGFRISCESLDIYPFYVLEGTLDVEVAGTSFILRAGASDWETVPAGEMAEVRAGDLWYFENSTPDGMTNLRNPGPEELRFVWVGSRQNTSRCNTSPPSGQRDVWHYLEDPTTALDPTRPVRLVLRKVTVPVGSVMEGEIGGMPIPTAEQEAMGARQWARILTGPLSMTRTTAAGEESTRTLTRYTMVTQTVSRSDDDERVTIANESDEPVELMVLDIIVGDPAAQGGVAAPPVASPVAQP